MAVCGGARAADAGGRADLAVEDVVEPGNEVGGRAGTSPVVLVEGRDGASRAAGGRSAGLAAGSTRLARSPGRLEVARLADAGQVVGRESEQVADARLATELIDGDLIAARLTVGVEAHAVGVDAVPVEGSEAGTALADFVRIGSLEFGASHTCINVEGFTSLALG